MKKIIMILGIIILLGVYSFRVYSVNKSQIKYKNKEIEINKEITLADGKTKVKVGKPYIMGEAEVKDYEDRMKKVDKDYELLYIDYGKEKVYLVKVPILVNGDRKKFIPTIISKKHFIMNSMYEPELKTNENIYQVPEGVIKDKSEKFNLVFSSQYWRENERDVLKFDLNLE